MSFKKAGINDVEYLLQGRLSLPDLDKLGIKQVMLALHSQGEAEPIPFSVLILKRLLYWALLPRVPRSELDSSTKIVIHVFF